MNNFSTTEEFFETPIQQFQFFDKYSRYRHDLKRRESWPETVDRVVEYLKKLSNYSLDNHVYKRIHQNILDLNVMPSMRLVAMAGPAADRTNVAIYNCSFMGINNIKAFAEALLISMSGCGVGFSVEHKYINELPELPEYLFNYDNTVVNEKPFIIEDSTEGWFDAINYLFNSLYYKNIIPGFDYSKIRPAGSVLVTKGGRASGPEPLRDCIDFIIDTFKLAIENKQNRLSSLQVHDIMCSIGQAAVSGGVRRTAMLSMFDKNDNDMLTCKTGRYNNYRWNANNTIVLDEDTTRKEYDVVMDSLFDGMTGEPGIFFEASNKHTAPTRRNHTLIAGMNPCGLIN